MRRFAENPYLEEIIIPKQKGNLSSKTYTREDTGEPGTTYTLWVNEWEEGRPYEDHSLDDVEGA